MPSWDRRGAHPYNGSPITILNPVVAESKKDTSLKSQFNLGDDKTADISVSRLESNPVASAALKANGISARDFVMTSLAYMQASMAAGMLKSVPNYKVPAGMNMKNIDFMNPARSRARKEHEGDGCRAGQLTISRIR